MSTRSSVDFAPGDDREPGFHPSGGDAAARARCSRCRREVEHHPVSRVFQRQQQLGVATVVVRELLCAACAESLSSSASTERILLAWLDDEEP